jgi:predicted amidohydrolase
VLLKSRAIENQIFVVGVNRTGLDGNRFEYKESSQVINPNGDLLGEFLSEDQLHVYEIDPSFINQFRQTFSTTQDRKSEVYKAIL